MSFLVQDFLDYAQIKEGKFRKQVKAFNIRETIENVMCIQRKKAEDTGLNFFATFLNIEEGQLVMADEQRIMQVLLNLQSNALKFTETGRVEIRVSIEEGDYLHIEVIDTGLGIKEED